MTELTIVAIPGADEYVNKISSEKVAHMTILFLGEAKSAESVRNIADYLVHTAETAMTRFGLDVDRRGTLGPQEADVLFFSERFTKDIRDIRSQLLKNDEIAKGFSSVEQWPEWTPHLTLGYPDAPAREDDRDYPGISWVNFDRIALWVDDFEGLVIPLKSQDQAVEVSMSDQLDNFLAHYGVKGMRWGVRKRRPSSGGSSTPTPTKAAPKKAASGEAVKISKNKTGRITKIDISKGESVPGRQMSDEELRRVISRIELDRKYNALTAPAPSKKVQAAKLIGEVLLDVGKQQAKVALTGVATKELQKRGLVAPPKDKKK